MTIPFAPMTSKLYETYYRFSMSNRNNFYIIYGSIYWPLFYFMGILVLRQACESTAAEAKAIMSVVLHKLRMKVDHSSTTKEEIRDFFTQLQSEDRNFTACRFFDIDFTLVCGILGAACMDLVIFISDYYDYGLSDCLHDNCQL